jgi:hypothetical protein
MIVNPRRKARESVSPLRTQAEVEQATIVADAWRERCTAMLVEAGERSDFWLWYSNEGPGCDADPYET